MIPKKVNSGIIFSELEILERLLNSIYTELVLLRKQNISPKYEINWTQLSMNTALWAIFFRLLLKP